MDFILPLPSFWMVLLVGTGTFLTIISFVFAASIIQPGDFASGEHRGRWALRVSGLATLVLGCACLIVTAWALWQFIPWYVAVPLIGLNLLYAPPLEEAFHKFLRSPCRVAITLCLANVAIITLMSGL